jgi:hypothetical protein
MRPAWSPQGDSLATIITNISGYSGKSTRNRNFLVDAHSLGENEYAHSNLLNPKVLWSQDSDYLFWIGTLPAKTGFEIGSSLVNRKTKQVIDMSRSMGQACVDYLTVTTAAWLLLS